MYSHLIQEQRYAIFALKQKGTGNAEIARTIKVSPSTVSRELRRNLTPRGKYIWYKAQAMADGRKHRHPGNRAVADTLRWRVAEYIRQEQWSPKQISGFLRQEGTSISHETIYRMIRSDKSGELARNCRHKMKYKPRLRMSIIQRRQHQEPHGHTRTPERGGRQAVRRLGDGPDS